jgi:cytochrome c oxidase subunit 2
MRRLAILLAVALATSACSSSFGMPRGASREGRAIFDLWQTMFVASIVVAALVYGLIAFAAVRYRARGRDDVIREPREHPKLEIAYTLLPLALAGFLWFVSWKTNEDVVAVRSDPDVAVDVEAYSWGWRFTYPELGVTVVSEPGGPEPQMVLPLDETSTIRLTAVDVVHAWYVPEFLYKHDAVPGRIARFDVTPREAGTFEGACTEFCGLNHAAMRFTVRVVPADEFVTWVEQLASAAATASPSSPEAST